MHVRGMQVVDVMSVFLLRYTFSLGSSCVAVMMVVIDVSLQGPDV